MDLAEQYRRQFAWRPWPAILAALPELAGMTVLDLGCGAGDLAAELSSRGARVIGVEANAALLQVAMARQLRDAEFRLHDLRTPLRLGERVDAIWCSFTAAYFPELGPMLSQWLGLLRPGGTIALIEVDDLFCHAPLQPRTRERLASYAQQALAAGRYDFHMGGKLEAHARRCGLQVAQVLRPEDRELAFQGPAPPEIVTAWRTRFQRMDLLRSFCGGDFDAVCADFLGCLARTDHTATAAVVCCVAQSAADR